MYSRRDTFRSRFFLFREPHRGGERTGGGGRGRVRLQPLEGDAYTRLYIAKMDGVSNYSRKIKALLPRVPIKVKKGGCRVMHQLLRYAT